MVTPGTVSGSLVRKVIILARLYPCSASGKAQPTNKSSTNAGSIPVSSNNLSTTAAAISSGLVFASAPFFAGVNGERE